MSSLVASGIVTPSDGASDKKFDMITTLVFEDIFDGMNDKTEWMHYLSAIYMRKSTCSISPGTSKVDDRFDRSSLIQSYIWHLKI